MKPASQRNTTRKTRKQKSRQVSYDSLEPRLPLTTFVVDVAGDAGNLSDGLISLREAAIAANTNAAYGDAPAGSADGDIINIHEDIAQIDLTQGAIELTDDVVLRSDSGSQVVITSDKTSGLFEVNSSERIGFSNLYFYNGSAAGGGAVRIEGGGITNFTNTTFQSNQATVGSGGAIYQVGGRLNVVDSVFSDNSAPQSDGGAIVSFAGSLNIQSSTFNRNSAIQDGAAIELVNGRLNTNDASFTNNWNYFGGTGTGGAISMQGSSIGRLQLGSFEGNRSTEGGGVWVSERSNLTVLQTAFSANYVDGDHGSHGGAIFNDGGNLFVSSANFDDNIAGGVMGEGGAIYSKGFNRIDGSSFSGNSASYSGGALQLAEGRLVMRGDSTLRGNEAGSSESTGLGGGLSFGGDATARVTETTMESNKASTSGGAVWMGEQNDVRILNSLISLNLAEGTEVNTGGGAIYNQGGKLVVSASQVNVNQSRAGGAVYLSGGTLNGQNNILLENVGERYGGAIANFGGQLQMGFTNFEGNTTSSTGKGGGLYVNGAGARALIFSSTFDANVSRDGGGAFIEDGSAMSIYNSTVQNNVATSRDGGGFHLEGYLRSGNVDYTNNNAGRNGGAVYIGDEGVARLNADDYESNGAVGNGGAIFDGGILVDNLLDFLDNSAGAQGDDLFELPVV